MAAFMITYDLKKVGQDYSSLSAAIKKLCPTHWNMLGSVWVVVYSGSATDIINHIKKHIDNNDDLIVVRLAGEAAWIGSKLTEHSGWIRDNLK